MWKTSQLVYDECQLRRLPLGYKTPLSRDHRFSFVLYILTCIKLYKSLRQSTAFELITSVSHSSTNRQHAQLRACEGVRLPRQVRHLPECDSAACPRCLLHAHDYLGLGLVEVRRYVLTVLRLILVLIVSIGTLTALCQVSLIGRTVEALQKL